jgi:hypothetical protein
MILTRCPGDHPVAVRASAAASNAVAENAKYTQRQRLPSIRATMRSVRRRAGGMMKNAVVAAIGQAMTYAFVHCSRKSDRNPRSRKVTRSVTMHTITLDIRSANINLGLASMIVRLSSVRRQAASILLNHSVRRPPAAAHPRQSLKKR